jgi:hypothetical protein
MAAGVRVTVQNNEGTFSPVGNKILHPIGMRQRITKDAAILVFVVHNVFHSPG